MSVSCKIQEHVVTYANHIAVNCVALTFSHKNVK